MFKKGFVWVTTEANDYFKLIKKCDYLGIKIKEIKHYDKGICLLVSFSDYEKLNKFLVSYKFRIFKHTGKELIVDKILKYKIFLFSLVIGICLFLVFTNMIFKVNIIHENKSIRELLKDELDSYGIKVLSFKKSYKELDKIRQSILDKYPDKLDWMEFDVRGQVVDVRVEERIITDVKDDTRVCDIVASNAGIVKDFVVFNGESKININDYVRSGDVLISGSVMYNEEEKRSVCASGKVFAEVWYTVSVSIPFSYDVVSNTGLKRYNLVWENKSGKKEILRSRFKEKEVKYKTLLDIFERKLYLTEEYEVKKEMKKHSEEEVIKEGLKQVDLKMESKLGKEDVIIDKKVLQKNVFDSKMDIDVFVIVRQLISTEVVREGY